MILDAIDLAAKAGPYVNWAWNNRATIDGFPEEAGDFLVSLAESGGDAVRRVGSQLVLGSPEAGETIIGFIDQAAPQLSHIETAVLGLESGQLALTGSVASLQTLSMVTLGLSAISPILLACQFRYLSNQFSSIKKSLHELKQIHYDDVKANLVAGLESLNTGVDKGNNSLIENALVPCGKATDFFAQQVAGELENSSPQIARLHYLARHLTVSVCATARTHIGLGYDCKAAEALEKHKPLLNQVSSQIFNNTLGKDPAQYLLPDLKDRVGLDVILSAFQQAEAAGILDAAVTDFVVGNHLDRTSLFEYLRPSLFKKRSLGFRKSVRIEQLLNQLQTTIANLEETNRVSSLLEFLKQAKENDRKASEVLIELDRKKKETGAEFVAWTF